MSVVKIDFHDRSPPTEVGKEEELLSLLKKEGDCLYFFTAGGLTQIDLETELTGLELQRYIVDNFQFIGSISFEGEIKIAQEKKHHGNANL